MKHRGFMFDITAVEVHSPDFNNQQALKLGFDGDQDSEVIVSEGKVSSTDMSHIGSANCNTVYSQREGKR